MDAFVDLQRWAETQGVELNGIRPDRIAGRGVGIIATRHLKAGEEILQVPTRALRILESVPRSIRKKLPVDISVQGLLATELALDTTAKFAAWNAVLPTVEDLSTIPLVWDPALQALLPDRASELLRKHQTHIAKDWAAVSAAFPSLAEDEYRHAWLLVNTRTFYHTTPATEKLRLVREDRLALQPVADLFNHAADGGCHVSFDAAGFTIATTRAFRRGEELCISYGAHSNDFLLAEYGFVLGGALDEEQPNRWDEIRLDEAVVLPALSARQRQLLDERGFLGNYVLDANTACYRTEVALRLMCVPLKEWQVFLDGIDDDDDEGEKRAQRKVDKLLAKLLRKHAKHIAKVLGDIKALDDVGEPTQRQLLATRWVQIQHLVETTIQRLEDDE